MQLDFLEGACPMAHLEREIMATSDAGTRGAVYTHPSIVEFMLDLIGYSATDDLLQRRLLEPSAGEGEFLIAAVRRLVESALNSFGEPSAVPIEKMKTALVGVELHAESVKITKEKIRKFLISKGFTEQCSRELVDSWLLQGDFLEIVLPGPFSDIVGNPPYIRPEAIPPALLAHYRSVFRTMTGRADIYIAFYEKSLQQLAHEGRLAFICADRWLKNQYGKTLRSMIARDFALDGFVDLKRDSPFSDDVSAYPAITVIRRGRQGRVAAISAGDKSLNILQSHASSFRSGESTAGIHWLNEVIDGAAPWILTNFKRLSVIRSIEERLPLIEDAGCKVGIGVATGADAVFIGSYEDLQVEQSRKLPLVMRRDLAGGKIKWHGKGLVNPFNDDGSLVDLQLYPMLKSYLEKNSDFIKNRNIAKRSPLKWYRTIDRIWSSLTNTKKIINSRYRWNTKFRIR